jgi:hypothetical protein
MQPRGRGAVAKSVVILSFLLLVAPLASAQIFKCIAKDGIDLYQNFPCGIESIGSMATKAPSDKAGLAQSDSKQTKPNTNISPNPNASLPTSIVAVKSAIPATEPRVGMTTEEVRAMWGEPTDTLWEEPGVGARSEVWSYGNTRSVRFVNNRVSAIEK